MCYRDFWEHIGRVVISCFSPSKNSLQNWKQIFWFSTRNPAPESSINNKIRIFDFLSDWARDQWANWHNTKANYELNGRRADLMYRFVHKRSLLWGNFVFVRMHKLANARKPCAVFCLLTFRRSICYWLMGSPQPLHWLPFRFIRSVCAEHVCYLYIGFSHSFRTYNSHSKAIHFNNTNSNNIIMCYYEKKERTPRDGKSKRTG